MVERAERVPEERQPSLTHGLPRVLAEAPWDDEPLTEEDVAAMAEADEDIRQGRVVADAELDRVLGW